MTTRFLASAALAIATLGLTACGSQSEEVAQAPEGITGLTVENARMILPAVSGNPAAIYLDIAYEGEKDATLAAVYVDGAEEAMMHEYAEKDYKIQMVPLESVALTKGLKVSFEPGGKHIMAMGVSPELTAGGKTEVTLIEAGGDKTTVTADIMAAGDAR
ncbi:copper chaperone PCu(A)C [Pontixanthobacter aquaemixtae]|uniref:Copper chaperone PCu(A)C n=1 Tax=Pontixanthobacter aquaemixtae TaxID=1958940 RepID=A0A844ZXM0_9SPHN|nr:copper chaperone PCu(A)C [Pontixanthobacter aquaemixtae]MXO90239.1 copper chaperone PCu(A)C [Pontixanthobacter aquaemixtae]